MTVGSRIREFRKRLGLSVDDVAEKLKKNRATIYRYESDDIENLPAPILEPLAKVLQTTPAELMCWEQAPAPASDDLPTLTQRDERQIAKDLEDRLHSLKGAAAMGELEDEEDMELLKASLLQAMTLSKRIAKKKFTPKKYRK